MESAVAKLREPKPVRVESEDTWKTRRASA